MSMLAAALILAGSFVAYANGANDNLKGVATLLGAGTTDYRRALAWATATTAAGSLCSLLLAGSLVRSFSGKGLVPDALAGAPEFLLAVALAAGLTVILATALGFPVSTTHGLTGALVGAGMAAAGARVDFAFLQRSFLNSLLLGPVLGLALGWAVYALLHRARLGLGLGKELCVCVGQVERAIPLPIAAEAVPLRYVRSIEPSIDTVEGCAQRYSGEFHGIELQRGIDALHHLSTGALSFARGLNDTPKIVALLLAAEGLGLRRGSALVAAAMALGGVLNARKVAETMSRRITPMNPGQAFAANLASAALVLSASRLGLPVSATHCTVGALFGIGLTTGNADLAVVRQIVLSWVLTLPVAAALAFALYPLARAAAH